MSKEDLSRGLAVDYTKFQPLIARCESILKGVFNGEPIRSAFDICESELIDRIIKLIFSYYSKKGNEENQSEMASLVDKVLINCETLDEEDTNPLVSFLATVNNLPDVRVGILKFDFNS